MSLYLCQGGDAGRGLAEESTDSASQRGGAPVSTHLSLAQISSSDSKTKTSSCNAEWPGVSVRCSTYLHEEIAETHGQLASLS